MSVAKKSTAFSAGNNIDVEPSGEALRMASTWLGMSAEEAHREAGPLALSAAKVLTKRPKFLGLGAKYLPHSKAMGTVCAVDNNLRKRLERGLAARQLLEEEERDERRGAVATGESWSTQDERRDRLGRGVQGVKRVNRPGLAQGIGLDQVEDSDDEDCKASVMQKQSSAGGHSLYGKDVSDAGVVAAVGTKAAREAALLYAPVSGSRAKRKRVVGGKS